MASENGRRRVVITGMGAVTPLGNDAETFWENLVAGRSGAGPITSFDPSEFAVHFACELRTSTRLTGSSTARRGGWTASRR